MLSISNGRKLYLLNQTSVQMSVNSPWLWWRGIYVNSALATTQVATPGLQETGALQWF